MYKLVYSENSIIDLKKIDKSIAQRIIKKLVFFAQQKDISKFSKQLNGFGNNKSRFRIGDYRAIFTVDKSGNIQILMILNIRHRREVYLK